MKYTVRNHVICEAGNLLFFISFCHHSSLSQSITLNLLSLHAALNLDTLYCKHELIISIHIYPFLQIIISLHFICAAHIHLASFISIIS